MEQRPAPVTLDHRVSEHMPALAPRPSTPSTPADIVRGTPRWPGVLILRPVTVFGPSSPTSQMVGTPSSEVSELIQTPEEVHRELVEPVAQSEVSAGGRWGQGRGLALNQHRELWRTPVPFPSLVSLHQVGGTDLVD